MTAFPQLLEAFARLSQTQRDRLYLSVNGYSTEQEIRLLETRGLALQPNLIISYILNVHSSNKAFDGYGNGWNWLTGRRALAKIWGRFRGDPSEYHHLIYAKSGQTVNRAPTRARLSRTPVRSLSRLFPCFGSNRGFTLGRITRFYQGSLRENGLAFSTLP
jgi:hypothetical protein